MVGIGLLLHIGAGYLVSVTYPIIMVFQSPCRVGIDTEILLRRARRTEAEIIAKIGTGILGQ
jgi:hypothetical protein